MGPNNSGKETAMETGKDAQRPCRGPWTFWAVGLGSLLWLLLRSGANPRRLTYPCQRTALVSGTAFLGYLATVVGLAHLYRLLRRKTTLGAVGTVGLTLLVTLSFIGHPAQGDSARVTAPQMISGWSSATAVSNVFVMPDVPVPECSLDGGSLPGSGPCSEPEYALADYGVDALIAAMEARSDFFYRTASHPTGIIGVADVVVIKVNNQWGGVDTGRLATNTDVLKGLIWRIVQHPAGFTGEVVIAENTQEVNPEWSTSPANAEDQNQSFQDVVDTFGSLGYDVSLTSWDYYGYVNGGDVGGPGYPAGEYFNGNNDDLYILLEDPAGTAIDELSYPKFTTGNGTPVSMRYGVWDGAIYHSDRLALINLPVLKVHGMAGATIGWKNLIGFIAIDDNPHRFGGWNAMHGTFWGYGSLGDVDYGLLGRQMSQVRAPDLTIVDAIWVATGNNTSGPVSREDVLLASTDPFAADWYASEYLLRPIADPGWVLPQDTSAARAGTFRNATRTNQNAAEASWPGGAGAYPYIDLLDSYDGSTPSAGEISQMNVFVASPSIFTDGFESGNMAAWSASVGE
jgi:hypothetical protein